MGRSRCADVVLRRDVAVIGAGHSVFGERNLSPKALFTEAFFEATESVDNGFDAEAIGEAYVGSLGFGGGQLGNLSSFVVAEGPAKNIPARRVENACASSGFAFRDAYLAVKSGLVDVALAGGVERMSGLTREHQRFWLGVSGDTLWERLAGVTFAGVYGLMAARHMHEYGTTKEQLARVAVKNHRFGAKNPKAQFQKEVTLEQCVNAPRVADPLGVYDCCSTTDGATVVLLARADVAKKFTDTPVWVVGSGAATDTLATHDRESLTRLDATAKAAKSAFQQSGLEPKQVNVAEVHDCFTIAELLALEDLGFCAKGQGGRFTEDGQSDRGGAVTVNPSGGLKAKGHPLGATGTSQVAEIYHQLRGEVPPERQAPDAEFGLAHNVGGSGATCTVHLFAR